MYSEMTWFLQEEVVDKQHELNAAITASQDVHHNIDALLNWVNDTEVNYCNRWNVPFVCLVYAPTNGIISWRCYRTQLVRVRWFVMNFQIKFKFMKNFSIGTWETCCQYNFEHRTTSYHSGLCLYLEVNFRRCLTTCAQWVWTRTRWTSRFRRTGYWFRTYRTTRHGSRGSPKSVVEPQEPRKWYVTCALELSSNSQK